MGTYQHKIKTIWNVTSPNIFSHIGKLDLTAHLADEHFGKILSFSDFFTVMPFLYNSFRDIHV